MAYKVKIIAISDVHGMIELRKIADIAIRRKAHILAIAGDIQNIDADRSREGYFEDEFLGMVDLLEENGVHVVGTPGNHDFYIQSKIGWKGFVDGVPNILVDKPAEIYGISFWCTPWVPTISGNWAYEADEFVLSDKFADIPEGVDVLISHTPPLGGAFNAFDVSLQRNSFPRRHLGSRALFDEIVKKKPKCVVCGHIHTGDHSLCRIGNTAVINCSLLDEHYREAYKPAEIMVEDGKMSFRTNGGWKWRTLTK